VDAAAAVRAELEGAEAAVVHLLEDDRAGAVAERTRVERSVQSRIFESTSPPTTSARCASPPASIP